MDKDIHTIMELVGNKNRFTIFIIGMNLFLWINVSILNYSLAFIETKPKHILKMEMKSQRNKSTIFVINMIL